MRAERVMECLAAVEKSAAPPREPNEEARAAPLLADLATGLWRIKQRIVEPGGEEPRAETRQVYRHVASMWDRLAAEEIEIQDHTGTPFDAGMTLTVLAFQPTAGLGREMVIETIKPTVYRQGRPIQMGQVIVGIPVIVDVAIETAISPAESETIEEITTPADAGDRPATALEPPVTGDDETADGPPPLPEITVVAEPEPAPAPPKPRKPRRSKGSAAPEPAPAIDARDERAKESGDEHLDQTVSASTGTTSAKRTRRRKDVP